MTAADLTIIGGGAAGMTAAISAAQSGIRVVLIEHNDRVGKKILSTGNGRCNLGNRSVSADDFGGSDPAFAMRVLSHCGPEETLLFLRRIGVPTVEEDGRIYPRTMQAATVTDALRFAMARARVQVRTDTCVRSAGRKKGFFILKTSAGDVLRTKALLFAPGGKAAPKTGSDGSADALIEGFGHTLVMQRPALVPLMTDAPYRRALSGLRADALIRLYADDTLLAAERGQVQFTDYGLSGIPVFQLSAAAGASLERGADVKVLLDLLPDVPQESVIEELKERQRTFSGDDLQTMLCGFLPKKLLTELLRLCGLRPSAVLRTDQTLDKLAFFSKNLSQHVTGTKGFDAAQTTAGGVRTDTLTTDLESKKVRGLFFAGEIVDIHGRCGGYNLQWAFSSGLCAGRSAARFVQESQVEHVSHTESQTSIQAR